jgi:adenylate cyclase
MSTEDVKRKLSAILSADVQGYSRLMGDDERATVETITAYRTIMTDLILSHNGRVVDAKGDNVLAEFSSVVDAVQAAVEIQKELEVKNADLPEHRRMAFRIGVNLGDVIEKGDTIYGDGVNIAARLESLAEGGGICISGTAFDQVGKKLPLGYQYMGEQKVKNIEKPIRAYKVLVEPEAVGKVIGERTSMKVWHWTALFGLLVLIVVVGSLTFWQFYMRPDVAPASVEKMAYPLPDKPSIAVLPFVDMSKDSEQEYFSDGITENIITSLATIPDLFVIDRNSTSTYKGKPVKVQEVSEAMGVRYVLEGSVLKSEDRVRVTTQLIDAISGKHLWAERYDRNLKDIFSVQDDITKRVIAAIQLKLTQGEAASVLSKRTNNLQAYLKHMEGRSYLYRMSIDGIAHARQLSEEAIALDPEYAAPYCLLGWTHLQGIQFGVSKSPKESLIQAAQLAKKALVLDESWYGAHMLLSQVLMFKRAYGEAIAEAEKGIALCPNDAAAHAVFHRTLFYAGRYEESLQAIERAVRLCPNPPKSFMLCLGSCYLHMGRYEEALGEFLKVIKHVPDDLLTRVKLAATYSLLGRETEARAEVAEVLRLNPKFSMEIIAKKWPYKNPDDLVFLTDALRKAGLT